MQKRAIHPSNTRQVTQACLTVCGVPLGFHSQRITLYPLRYHSNALPTATTEPSGIPKSFLKLNGLFLNSTALSNVSCRICRTTITSPHRRDAPIYGSTLPIGNEASATLSRPRDAPRRLDGAARLDNFAQLTRRSRGRHAAGRPRPRDLPATAHANGRTTHLPQSTDIATERSATRCLGCVCVWRGGGMSRVGPKGGAFGPKGDGSVSYVS